MEHLFRDECDTIRLLIDEFNHFGAEYFVRNASAINDLPVRDNYEYSKPEVVPSILSFMTSMLLVHILSLLEYRLPIMVEYYFNVRGIEPNEPIDKYRDGNILDWLKGIMKTSDEVTIDFSDSLYERLKAWIRVRNDEVHNGGYRSARITDHQIKILHGVDAGEVGTLYHVQFGACQNAINDVEAFLLRVDVALRPQKIA